MANSEKLEEQAKMNFVHLHNHTEFSLLDGIARYKELIKTSKKMGMPAVAITDHGNMYASLAFYTECLVSGIKPIIGCEFYVSKNHLDKVGRQKYSHLILLAKNNVGYHNLLKLDSIAFVDGFHIKPRIDYDLLEKYSEGLICLSACLAGDIPQFLLNGQTEQAENLALRLKNMFADGDFYIELQNHNLPEELEVLPKLDALAKKIGVKTVGTNDVHYIKKEDSEIQDILMCVQMQKTYDDPTRLKFATDEFYLKTREEMEHALSGFTECLNTTLEIADKCDVVITSKAHAEDECHVKLDEKYVLPKSKNFIPAYVNDLGIDNYEYLRKLTFDGLKKKYSVVTQDLIDRAEYELDTIHTLGFVEYFLIVWDYINYAKTQGIPVGPGRGSGAGSIVAYTSGITDIDPIKYGLFFERFINKERVSMPDFDVDFCMNRRSEVVDYTKRKYGADHVANIIAFGTMAAKAVIKDVGRVLRVPYSETDKCTKLIPNKLPDGIKKPPVLKYYFGLSGEEGKEKYIISDLREMYDTDDTIKRVVDLAVKIEGCPRNTTTHACGVLIAPDSVSNFVPLQRNGEDVTTQYNMIELEQLGLLKMDFLGLRTLTDIELCLEMIKTDTNRVVDFNELGVDDPKVYELISSGNTDTIFQIESGGFKKNLKDLKPDCLEDIIAAVSLYRPGPMESFPVYIKNKHNPEQIVYDSPILEPILNVTYGCIVYQEQVMKIVQEMGGYSLGQADNVRRIMGKKKKEKMAEERQKFIYGYKDPLGKHDICGALSKGVSEEVANKVFSQMESFASYAFNKSHAAAYSFITYRTAWLKNYYPVYWLASFLNNRINNAKAIKKYQAYAKTQDIEVLPPNINKSKTYFSVENEKIRYGLCALKGMGTAVCDEMVAEREKHGEYKDISDFISRQTSQTLNKRCLESLILSGAFDCFDVPRSQLISVYAELMEQSSVDRKNREMGQFSLFDDLLKDDSALSKVNYPKIPEYTKQIKLKFEKEVVGSYMSGHPLDEYSSFYKNFNVNSSMMEPTEESEFNEEGEEIIHYEYPDIEDGQRAICGGIIVESERKQSKSSGKDLGILKIEDIYGTFEVMMFPTVYSKFKALVNVDSMITIEGKVSVREGQSPVIIADKVTPWQIKSTEEGNQAEEKPHKLYLKFDMTNSELYDNIINVLKNNQGNTEVVSKCTTQNKAFKMPYNVDVSSYLMNELKGFLNEDCILYV